MQDRIQFSATINRKPVGPVDVPKDLMMIEFLQEYAGMNGTRLGCGQGVCRACTIIVDDPEKGSITVPACVTGVTWLNGKTIRTVEGIASVDDKGVVHPSPVQKAFLEHYSFQCGYCTGFVNSATVLVEKLRSTPCPPMRWKPSRAGAPISAVAPAMCATTTPCAT
jgi:aerobic-type carbon monoxide dehydrogenase small subunit (CoxS/CutS family)